MRDRGGKDRTGRLLTRVFEKVSACSANVVGMSGALVMAALCGDLWKGLPSESDRRHLEESVDGSFLVCVMVLWALLVGMECQQRQSRSEASMALQMCLPGGPFKSKTVWENGLLSREREKVVRELKAAPLRRRQRLKMGTTGADEGEGGCRWTVRVLRQTVVILLAFVVSGGVGERHVRVCGVVTLLWCFQQFLIGACWFAVRCAPMVVERMLMSTPCRSWRRHSARLPLGE